MGATQVTTSRRLGSTHKKIKAALAQASWDGELKLGLDDALAEFGLDDGDSLDMEGNLDSDSEELDDYEFSPGDVLGKALALVKQIRASPQAHKFFRDSCTQVGITPLETHPLGPYSLGIPL
ncbi:hypothetical protein BD779DRAFT_1682141 [Infundibulicybe gibba]|nr:hypothetical protein BD779DRAFT_1682141 [Infundibulicybe gibba]